MENIALYIAKACGLTAMFYAAYYLLLKKETFFKANRWFLLAGLLTSALLPLAVYTKIVWISPVPQQPVQMIQLVEYASVAATAPQALTPPFEINWWLVALGIYAAGTAFLLARLVIDFKKVYGMFKGQYIKKLDNYKIIDSEAAKSPFSFFNYIIYNSASLEPDELQDILSHEKVHSSQLHSADVIIAQLFCAVFWFNPFAWLYKKAIAQNLEFIADAEAVKHAADIINYQKTLLKITLRPSGSTITNHFYQSLIKKRIIMLNKPKSKKQNSWKFAVVLPLLAVFVMLFQVEVIAQEKAEDSIPTQTNADSSDSVIITQYIKDEDLDRNARRLTEKYGLKVAFSEISRNVEGYITSIKAEVTGGMGQNVTDRKYQIKGLKPIGTFTLTIKKTGNVTEATFSQPKLVEEKLVLGKYDENEVPLPATDDYTDLLVVIDGVKQPKGTDVEELPENIASINILKGPDNKYGEEGKKGVIEVVTKKNRIESVATRAAGVSFVANPLYVIDGVKQPKGSDALRNLDSHYIKSITVLKNSEAVDKYGEDGPDGVIEIITETSADRYNMDTPPSEIARQNSNHKTFIKARTITSSDDEKKTTWAAEGAVQITSAKDNNGKADFRLADDGNSGFLINKKSTDADLDNYAEILAKNGLVFKYSGIKRNSSGEIIKIRTELKDNKKNKASGTFENDKGIATIYVGKKEGILIIKGK